MDKNNITHTNAATIKSHITNQFHFIQYPIKGGGRVCVLCIYIILFLAYPPTQHLLISSENKFSQEKDVCYLLILYQKLDGNFGQCSRPNVAS